MIENYICEKINMSTYIVNWKYTFIMIKIITKLDEMLSSILNINWL
jgi:hypothetical protein